VAEQRPDVRPADTAEDAVQNACERPFAFDDVPANRNLKHMFGGHGASLPRPGQSRRGTTSGRRLWSLPDAADPGTAPGDPAATGYAAPAAPAEAMRTDLEKSLSPAMAGELRHLANWPRPTRARRATGG